MVRQYDNSLHFVEVRYLEGVEEWGVCLCKSSILTPKYK